MPACAAGLWFRRDRCSAPSPTMRPAGLGPHRLCLLRLENRRGMYTSAEWGLVATLKFWHASISASEYRCASLWCVCPAALGWDGPRRRTTCGL